VQVELLQACGEVQDPDVHVLGQGDGDDLQTGVQQRRMHTVGGRLAPQRLGEADAAERLALASPGLLEPVQARAEVEPPLADRVEALMEWASDARFKWGTGATRGAWQIRWPHPEHNEIWPITIGSEGKVEVPFGSIAKRHPFTDEGLREEYRQKLNDIDSVVQIAADGLGGWPTFPLSVIESDDGYERLVEALAWFRRQLQPPSRDDGLPS
jgi:hypothetical protein